MMSIDVTPKPPFMPGQCDWSAGSHRRSLAEVLVDTAPGCDSAAPGQHEVGRASGPDSPHLRSGISTRACPRRSRSQRDPPRSPAPDDHAERAPRPEPARACSTSPETMSHHLGRDTLMKLRQAQDDSAAATQLRRPWSGPIRPAGRPLADSVTRRLLLTPASSSGQKCRIPDLRCQA
jgi:hypothetical protein